MPTSVRPKDDLDSSLRAQLDHDIAALREGATTWGALTLTQRISLLRSLRRSVAGEAEEWARTAARSKALDVGHPLEGEEWLSGPYATLLAVDTYIATLSTLRVGGGPLDRVPVDRAWGDRVRVHVFPEHPIDNLLLSGYSGEVWLRPGVTEAQARRAAGLGQLRPGASGGVGLVLGAGNITSIPVLDVIYELLAHNRVSLLKLNPTQNSLTPILERALAPLVSAQLLRIVQGAGAVGAYLTGHEGIDHVHITGAAATFNAIVWGQTGARRTRKTPVLRTPITAELGGVSPIIVVPGQWTDADLTFQAEHVATMRLHNSGHNCIAGQVVILSAHWPQREAFLTALSEALDRAPQRPVWYPGGDARLSAAAESYPAARWTADHTRALIEIGPDDDPTAAETTEYFAPVLAVVSLPGDGQEFLDTAVTYANERLVGTLGANLLIDPATQDALGDGVERAIADLRYGTVAVNTWTGLAFATPGLPWGAFPGATLDDVESGIGVVHNAFLLDDVEKSVMRGPFRPFPRSLSTLGMPGTFSALPRPPWFVTSTGGADASRLLTSFRVRPRVRTVAAIIAAVFRP